MRILPDFILARALEEVKGLEKILGWVSSAHMSPVERKAIRYNMIRNRSQYLDVLSIINYQAPEENRTPEVVQRVIQLISPDMTKDTYPMMMMGLTYFCSTLYFHLGGKEPQGMKEFPGDFLERINSTEFCSRLAAKLSEGYVPPKWRGY